LNITEKKPLKCIQSSDPKNQGLASKLFVEKSVTKWHGDGRSGANPEPAEMSFSEPFVPDLSENRGADHRDAVRLRGGALRGQDVIGTGVLVPGPDKPPNVKLFDAWIVARPSPESQK